MNNSGTKLEFHELYETFHQKIHRYLNRFVDEQEAADLTQEVFIKVNRALSRFRGESTVSTWIYRIATNVALDRTRQSSFKNLKKQQFISESELEIEEIKPWSKEAEAQLDRQFIKKEMNQCIRGFIDKLPVLYFKNG